MDLLTWIIAAGGALTVFATVWKLASRRYRRVRPKVVAAWHSIFGREAIVDTTTGRVIEPALPGIGMQIATQGTQLASQGTQLGVLTEAVATLLKSNARVDDLEARVGVHDRLHAEHAKSIKELQDAAVERIVTRSDSANAWRAVEAAIKAQPDEDVESFES